MKTFLLSIFCCRLGFIDLRACIRTCVIQAEWNRVSTTSHYSLVFRLFLVLLLSHFHGKKKEKRICVLLRRVRAHVSIYSDLLKFAVCACVFSLCDFSKCTLNSICAHSFLNLVDRMIVNFLINICPHWHICQAYGLWCACVQKRKIWHSI